MSLYTSVIAYSLELLSDASTKKIFSTLLYFVNPNRCLESTESFNSVCCFEETSSSISLSLLERPNISTDRQNTNHTLLCCFLSWSFAGPLLRAVHQTQPHSSEEVWCYRERNGAKLQWHQKGQHWLPHVLLQWVWVHFFTVPFLHKYNSCWSVLSLCVDVI